MAELLSAHHQHAESLRCHNNDEASICNSASTILASNVLSSEKRMKIMMAENSKFLEHLEQAELWIQDPNSDELAVEKLTSLLEDWTSKKERESIFSGIAGMLAIIGAFPRTTQEEQELFITALASRIAAPLSEPIVSGQKETALVPAAPTSVSTDAKEVLEHKSEKDLKPNSVVVDTNSDVSSVTNDSCGKDTRWKAEKKESKPKAEMGNPRPVRQSSVQGSQGGSNSNKSSAINRWEVGKSEGEPTTEMVNPKPVSKTSVQGIEGDNNSKDDQDS